MATSETIVFRSSIVWILPFHRMRSGPLGGAGGSAVTRRADVVIQPAAPPTAAATPAVAPVFRRVRREIPFLAAASSAFEALSGRRDFFAMVPPSHCLTSTASPTPHGTWTRAALRELVGYTTTRC